MKIWLKYLGCSWLVFALLPSLLFIFIENGPNDTHRRAVTNLLVLLVSVFLSYRASEWRSWKRVLFPFLSLFGVGFLGAIMIIPFAYIGATKNINFAPDILVSILWFTVFSRHILENKETDSIPIN